MKQVIWTMVMALAMITGIRAAGAETVPPVVLAAQAAEEQSDPGHDPDRKSVV